MRFVGVIVIAALLAGCGSESTSPRILPGAYTLRAVRGGSLPAVLQQDPNYSLEILGGSIALDGDLTFRESRSIREYRAGSFTTSMVDCIGTWTPTDGQHFSLREAATPGCADTAIGEWNGRDKVTIVWTSFATDADYAR